MTIDPKLKEEIAKMIADGVAAGNHELLSKMGYDADDQRSINRLRAAMIYLDNMRKFSSLATARFWWVVFGAIAVGTVTAFWKGVKSMVAG